MGVDCLLRATFRRYLVGRHPIHPHDSAVFPAVTPDVLSLPLQGADRAVFPIGRRWWQVADFLLSFGFLEVRNIAQMRYFQSNHVHTRRVMLAHLHHHG